MSVMRRVLLIAYFFPPLGGAGVQRAVKFAKYLPENGWLPTVLTTRSAIYPVSDPTLSGDVPDEVQVIRARQPRGAMAPAVALSALGLGRAARVAGFPDAAAAWIPDAVRQGLRAARNQPVEVLLSTSAPPSAHLVALAIHRRTGIPWVADFRDEWAANPGSRDDPAVVRSMARTAERTITSRAGAVTIVEDYFDIANPAGTTIAAIPNGVDEDDLRGLDASAPPTDRLRLSFVGSLYDDRDPAPVVAALARLGERGVIDLGRIEIRVVGNDWRAGERRWPVAVEQTGYVSHGDALIEMCSASALLHYVGPSSRAPGGKIYEYLASGRPVLCIAPTDGRAAALVRDSGAGPIAAPDDPDGIERAIVGLYERWLAGGLVEQTQVRRWVLDRYSRRYLTAQLGAVLDSVATKREGDSSSAGAAAGVRA